MFSIRQRQIDACKRMLSLNQTTSSDGYWQSIWKILIYDEFCRDVLAPLFTVEELHKAGVTLHLCAPNSTQSVNFIRMLNANNRQEVPDVPAVYFVRPTKENIAKICQDCSQKIYDTYHFNFVSSLPRELLEELAVRALESDSVKQIAKIYDQYLDFISLEDSLFILNQKNSYVAFHNPIISNQEAGQNIDLVVDSLFSVLVTLGKVPIIQCPRGPNYRRNFSHHIGDAAEIIAKKLDQKIRDQISTTPNLFTESATLDVASGSSFQRPVLLLLDRNIDLSIMLSHSWSYQALIHDLFDMHLNRIRIEAQNKKTNKMETVSYDFDGKDSFYEAHVGDDFPSVLGAIKQNVTDYQNKAKRTADADTPTTIDEINEKMAQLPGLEKHKELAAMHVNIAEGLLKLVNARNLDVFFKYEEDIMTHSSDHSTDIAEVLKEHGTVEDKLRLFLIYYLSHSNKMTAEELARFETMLTGLGCDLAPLKYLQKIKAFDKNWATATSKNKQQHQRQDWLMDMFSSMVTKGIESLIPVNKDYFVTRLVNAVMDLEDNKDTKDYLYLDPKFPTNPTRKNTPFKEAIVFMIGGGNYLEYQNIKDFLKKKSQLSHSGAGLDRKIIYGTTQMLNGKMFLEQLSTLGNTEKK